MVLNRNPDNFFAETEQVAFHPGHVVPGIDFTNDPLLQGRLFSYHRHAAHPARRAELPRDPDQPAALPDAQLPARRPSCAMDVPKGRVAYEPNSLDPDGPRENAERGFASFAEPESGDEGAQRPGDLRRSLLARRGCSSAR